MSVVSGILALTFAVAVFVARNTTNRWAYMGFGLLMLSGVRPGLAVVGLAGIACLLVSLVLSFRQPRAG